MAGPKSKASVERLEDEAQHAAGRAMLREAPYAGIGLGHVVADSVRNLDTGSLSERIRRAPGAVASKMTSLGTGAKTTYLALAARGHTARAQAAAEEATDDVIDLTTDAAEVVTEPAKGLAGRMRRITSRAAKEDDTATESEATESDPPAGTGTGPLEKRTLAQLRERARELDIEGRTTLKKQDLIAAIRDAT